jgi:hypothetical protein
MTSSNHDVHGEDFCPALLNNRAIAFLQVGQENEAMELLGKGLSLLRKKFLVSSSQRQPGRSRCLSTLETTNSSTTAVSSVPLPFLHSHVFGRVEMYNRGLLIHHPSPRINGEVTCCCCCCGGTAKSNLLHPHSPPPPSEVWSAVILYNMGLMHHRRGMMFTSSAATATAAATPIHSIRMIRYLDDACELYRIGLYVLDQSPLSTSATVTMTVASSAANPRSQSHLVDDPLLPRPGSSSSSSLLLSLLRLALLNNLLQIASQRSRVATFRYALVDMYHVLSRVAMVIHHHQQDQRRRLLHTEASEYALFYSNWEHCCCSLGQEEEEEEEDDDENVEIMTLAPAA